MRMRWHWGFCRSHESFVANYKTLLDAAHRYSVEAVVIWGFLRDEHGGIDAAKEVREHAEKRGVRILPGFGVDDYGGAYYEGSSRYALDNYLTEHPEAQAVDKNGNPATHLWPPMDTKARKKACPSDGKVLDYYRESLEWLLREFDLDGFQIEQGDSGLCYCDRCRERQQITHLGERTSVSDGARRIGAVVKPFLEKQDDLLIVSETYLGMSKEELETIASALPDYPEGITLSWQLYDDGRMKVDEGVKSPRPHGVAALRTNSDVFYGVREDGKNIAEALRRSKAAGLDWTYIYGEHPDDRPVVRDNYEAWYRHSV